MKLTEAEELITDNSKKDSTSFIPSLLENILVDWLDTDVT